jgi:hypothetical protein
MARRTKVLRRMAEWQATWHGQFYKHKSRREKRRMVRRSENSLDKLMLDCFLKSEGMRSKNRAKSKACFTA